MLVLILVTIVHVATDKISVLGQANVWVAQVSPGKIVGHMNKSLAHLFALQFEINVPCVMCIVKKGVSQVYFTV